MNQPSWLHRKQIPLGLLWAQLLLCHQQTSLLQCLLSPQILLGLFHLLWRSSQLWLSVVRFPVISCRLLRMGNIVSFVRSTLLTKNTFTYITLVRIIANFVPKSIVGVTILPFMLNLNIWLSPYRYGLCQIVLNTSDTFPNLTPRYYSLINSCDLYTKHRRTQYKIMINLWLIHYPGWSGAGLIYFTMHEHYEIKYHGHNGGVEC